MKPLNSLFIVMMLIVLLIFPSCDDSMRPGKNQPPVIESISSTPSTSSTNRLPGGTTFQIGVVATDPDRDVLSYIWQSDKGQFEGEIDRSTVRWTAPVSDRETVHVIKVTVSDGALSVQGNINIYVDKAVAPTVTTGSISNITETSAHGGGAVTSDGGTEVTARGVVWSRSTNPTLSSNGGYTTDGSGTGLFTSDITGLNPRTSYYVRAYATNIHGTSYGSQIRFRTGSIETGTVTDIDGNTYQTVKIGDQWWMAENLRTTRYRNGDAIPTNLDNTQWGNTASGAYAIYPHGRVGGINSDEEMVDAYGKLYNWYAVDDDRGLCPEGWHVPTDAEWTVLVDYVVSQGYLNFNKYVGGGAGKALKSRRQVNSPLGAPWATNEHPRWDSHDTHHGLDVFGFSGLPGGYRLPNGGYLPIGINGGWGSSTEHVTVSAWTWIRYLSHDVDFVGRNNGNKQGGFSVRCLRD